MDPGPIGLGRQLTQLTLESMDWFQEISTGNKGMDCQRAFSQGYRMATAINIIN